VGFEFIGGVRAASMAICAGEMNRRRRMHRLDPHVTLCGLASVRLSQRGRRKAERGTDDRSLSSVKLPE
jgi:hypothetical protein